ncbi:hypothetical protein ACFVXQ_32190 [Kitasatospora sp. NPDC058263]
MVLLVLACLAVPALRHFDRDVPDAEPDDLVGLAALTGRTTTTAQPTPPPTPILTTAPADTPPARRTGTEAAVR